MSVNQTARTYNISRKTVREVAKVVGPEPRPPRHEADQVKEAAGLYVPGLSSAAVGQSLGFEACAFMPAPERLGGGLVVTRQNHYVAWSVVGAVDYLDPFGVDQVYGLWRANAERFDLWAFSEDSWLVSSHSERSIREQAITGESPVMLLASVLDEARER